MFDRLFRYFRRTGRPVAQDDVFSQPAWLGPDQNPFGMRVLDCRPFSRHPADPLTAPCDLSYPFNGESRDGPPSCYRAECRPARPT